LDFPWLLEKELFLKTLRAALIVTPLVQLVSHYVLVRGHPSISLPLLSSPTLPLFICTPSPHLCTISRDYTQSQQLPHQWPNNFPDVDSPEADNFHPPSSLGPEQHWMSRRRIRTGPHDTMAPSAITWTPIYERLDTRRLGTVVLCISFVD
jgi:hypothetical protein